MSVEEEGVVTRLVLRIQVQRGGLVGPNRKTCWAVLAHVLLHLLWSSNSIEGDDWISRGLKRGGWTGCSSSWLHDAGISQPITPGANLKHESRDLVGGEISTKPEEG